MMMNGKPRSRRRRLAFQFDRCNVGAKAGSAAEGLVTVGMRQLPQRTVPKPGFCFGNRVSHHEHRNPVSKPETGFRTVPKTQFLLWKPGFSSRIQKPCF